MSKEKLPANRNISTDAIEKLKAFCAQKNYIFAFGQNNFGVIGISPSKLLLQLVQV